MVSFLSASGSAPETAERMMERAKANLSASKGTEPEMYSLHGEQAAKRRAIGELIFFSGTNDLRRCKQIANMWGIKVSDEGIKDYDSRTPLHIAAAEGAFSVVSWLVSQGAELNPLDRHKKTPLEEAARKDHAEVVRLLVERGACLWEDGQFVRLEKSKLRYIVDIRQMRLNDLGWDPEWEVDPRELKMMEMIGSGEFGNVYRCKWRGSFVAAKLLKRSDEIALGDFRTEIATLRKIHHPNCTQFLGACTKQKPYIVITELMACSLADAISQTYFTPTIRRQVEVALDFARGMAYLHSRSQPIVHRDLKPANLMIAGNLHADTEQLFLDSGVIKVADFGLSKSLTPVERHGAVDIRKDTATYKLTGETGSYRCMAPEVFRHEPYSLTVDVYSYAMILFQISEKEVPYGAMDSVEAAKEAALYGRRPKFPTRVGMSDAEIRLRELIKECWSEEAVTRPSFEEIINRLEDLLQELPKHSPYQKREECCSLQ